MTDASTSTTTGPRTREIDGEWRIRAYVSHVVDGDTIAAELDLGLRINVGSSRKKILVRFAGGDAAESGAKSKTAAARKKAQEATDFVKARLAPGQMVWIATKSKNVEREDFDDKYGGRVDGKLWYLPPQPPPPKKKPKVAPPPPKWIDLAHEMVLAGLAKDYDGGKKEAWE